MPLLDSQTGKITKQLSAAELTASTALARGYALLSIYAAGSGHPGGSLSIMDIACALYLNVMKHDPQAPSWEGRDRCFWSAGHKAPALYVNLALAGYNLFPLYSPLDSLMTLRKLYSPLQGHPHWKKIPGLEFSSGSLGQGLSVAVGSALAAKKRNQPYHVYCLMGDGEQQEGQVWEAAMSASHYSLDNLTLVLDLNRLQIDGLVKEVMNIEPLKEKYRSFGWHPLVIDGHDITQILSALHQSQKIKGPPSVILAQTIKGKGVSFMENKAEWHGQAPSTRQQLDRALYQGLHLEKELPPSEVDRLLSVSQMYQEEVKKTLLSQIPSFPSQTNYFWNPSPPKNYYLFSPKETMKVVMEPTRFGFGRALQQHGDEKDKTVFCLGADISGSIKISDFYKDHPERKERFISLGIAEANGAGVAAGLAKEGLLPVFGTYGVFSVGRALDQLRTTICYGELNILLSSAHAGVSVGPDGATHQALEDIATLLPLPNLSLVVPCDSLETEKATCSLLFDLAGPKALRFAREATPLITKKETPFVFGQANLIRYRQEKENFLDAFETQLASQYSSEDEALTFVACGPMVPEALRAAYILEKEYHLKTRIINLHSLKVPLSLRAAPNLPFSKIDQETLIRAAQETQALLTIEEHQVGGFGNYVAAALLEAPLPSSFRFKRIGVADRFGESGDPWELTYEFGLAAEHLAQAAKKLLE